MPKDLSGLETGMTPQNPVNNPRPAMRPGLNAFPQTFYHPTTDRYGEYSPYFWAKCERGDVQNLSCTHDLSTFTMKSPMKGNVTMTKSFVKVNMEAIYPRNWDKMMTIPTQGDDVPADTRALLDVRRLVQDCVDNINAGDSVVSNLVLLELVTSDGALFPRFNMHLNYRFLFGEEEYAPDDLFNFLWALVLDVASDREYAVVGDDDIWYSLSGDNRVSERRFLELIRAGYTLSDDFLTFQFEMPLAIEDGYISSSSTTDIYERFLNIEPIIAYQLACAQFATDDSIDFIYTAQLYRDNMQSILLELDSAFPTFLYNGVQTQYDVFSARVFNLLIDNGDSRSFYKFFINLFSYWRSLRFGDYFIGAKPRPLAVGEYSAEVVDGSVSAIDVTKSIMMQRLLNRVNMIGRRFGNYLAGIFGGRKPDTDYTVPIFLAHQHFDIKGFEVNNTGAAQLDETTDNITTTNLRTVENRTAFEIEIERPCYVIAMNSYSMPRIYSRTMDRFAFHHDRYDDFIPQMQYIGDQDIKATELDSLFSSVPYGYCLRYMEYKQRYSYASGGFIRYLPSWSFITDNSDGNPAQTKITPEYIRSSPTEFDRFYKSLTGYSLGSYFHFIVFHTNHTSPLRAMEYSPEILK